MNLIQKLRAGRHAEAREEKALERKRRRDEKRERKIAKQS
jgi:hypothetical protein